MKYPLLIGVISCSLIGLGCQGSTEPSAQVQQLETRVIALEKKVEELISAPAKATTSSATATPGSSVTAHPDSSGTPSAVGASSPNDSATAGQLLWQTLSYDSLPSPEKLKELVSLGALAKINVADQKAFEGELTRGQYVALLVEMNNLLHDSEQQIRLARDGDGQAFDDVPPSHSFYKYIQGMVDAGYVIGFNEKTFQPDKTLTREEMVAIAAKRDYNFDGFDAKYTWEHHTPFTDKNDIAPKYREAVSKDFYETSRSNLKQSFGELKLFHPKKTVRVYEALLSTEGVGDHSVYTYNELVQKAMGQE